MYGWKNDDDDSTSTVEYYVANYILHEFFCCDVIIAKWKSSEPEEDEYTLWV